MALTAILMALTAILMARPVILSMVYRLRDITFKYYSECGGFSIFASDIWVPSSEDW